MPGNAVLALGVAAVLMTVWEMKWQHKAIWLSLVFFLAFLEHKSIDKDRFDSNEQTRRLVENTTRLVTQVGLFAPQLVQYSNQLADFKTHLQLAERNHDMVLSTELRDKIARVQKQYDDTSIALVLANASNIIAQMDGWLRQWREEDLKGRHRTPAGRGDPEYLNEMPILEQKYAAQMKPTMTAANFIRQQLLGVAVTIDDPFITQTQRRQAFSFEL